MRQMVVAGLAALGMMAGAAQAAIVQNGSFEQSFATPGKRNGGQVFDKLQSGRGSSWQVWDALPGWTTKSGYGIEVQSNRTLRGIDAQHGLHYLEMDSNNNSSMVQEVVLDMGEHMLEFFYSPRTQRAQSNDISWGLDGLTKGVVSDRDAGTKIGQWTRVTQVFNVAKAGTYTLGFGALGRSDGLGGLLDNVSITAMGLSNTPAPVPLPGAALMLASAAGALVSIRRLRRART
ncbi:hypothetical protein [Fluviibacterium sp. S390]|uniref:hypothetical protein n=1 Tax=Fluviibacterium sp. S390 TaxID=3415139 RepID=UPI003C7C6B21